MKIGNGVKPDGTYVTNNNPLDTYFAADHQYWTLNYMV